ncbi:hypothetical protein AVEN_204170-1 [Araneus ventricosus]|uniref:Uncharacterized protein n=1 Tax=Araneus ventricosus TaxID=182803 RepID=A0A4Y2PKS1_ARAVE|nr:hypothetical protein AVEN_204170-1 [Araneus ventricosus]
MIGFINLVTKLTVKNYIQELLKYRLRSIMCVLLNLNEALLHEAGIGGLEVGFRLRDWRVPGSKSDPTEDPPCMGPVMRLIRRSGQTCSRWCGTKSWRRVAISGTVLVF